MTAERAHISPVHGMTEFAFDNDSASYASDDQRAHENGSASPARSRPEPTAPNAQGAESPPRPISPVSQADGAA